MISDAASMRQPVAKPTTASRRKSGRRRTDFVTAMIFLAPFMILLLIFQYVPLFFMLRNSFYSYSLLNPADGRFIGLRNFTGILNDPDALNSFGVTLAFAAGLVLTIIPLSFLVALFLNAKLPARALVRTIIMLPVVTSAVVVSTIWTFLLDPSNGLINGALGNFGIGPFGFLTDHSQALPALVAMALWQQVGFATILFLAGLQNVPVELGEAALVDGATRTQRLWHITIPLLSRTTLFIVVIMTVFSLQAFAPAFLMTAGGPQSSTNFIVYSIYQTAFSMQQAGYASALSVVLLLIIFLISAVQMYLLRVRWNY